MRITFCIATVNGVAAAMPLTTLLVPPVVAESAGANPVRRLALDAPVSELGLFGPGE
jgi:hypothetical protein